MALSPSNNDGRIPEALSSRLDYLAILFSNLPSHLPLSSPSSNYQFFLGPEDVNEEGYGYALNRRLELAFQTSSSGTSGRIVFKERGPCFDDLLELFRTTAKQLSASDCAFYIERWVERIIVAATEATASSPTSKRKHADSNSEEPSTKKPRKIPQAPPSSPINLNSDDDEDLPPHPSIPPSASTSSTTRRIPSASSTSSSAFTSMSSHQPPNVSSQGPSRQHTLFDFGIKQVTYEEYNQQQVEFAQAYSKTAEQKRAQEAKARTRQKEHELELNRLRQAQHRKKVKNAKSTGVQVREAILGYDKSSTLVSDVAKMSRPEKNWKDKRNGKNGGTVQCRHERVNWYHPFLWVHIARVAPRVNWSPNLIVTTLRANVPELFSSLHRGTISKWIVKGGKGWTTQTLENVQRRSALSRSGRVGVLEPYPDVVEEIKDNLRGYRTSGIPISRLVARTVMLAIIQHRAPQVLQDGFKCSEFFVGQFLQSTLDWSVVWSGSTARSLPNSNAIGMDEALEFGFQFTFAASKKKTSHFSTLKTMKEWMVNILKPWIDRAIKDLKLPADQKAILFIDCYPVHTGEEFRVYVFKDFPHIFLIFVPANCNHTKQIDDGLTPEQVKFTTAYPQLRNASVKPIVEAFKFFNNLDGQAIIRKAWEKCTVEGFNLGKECIESRETKAAYRDYLASDETFRSEIRNKIGTESFDKMEAQLQEEEREECDDDGAEDDSDIPLDIIIKEVNGLDIQVANSGRFTHVSTAVERGEDGSLRPTAEMEDVWSYDKDGTPMATVMASIASVDEDDII
ncbi:hypothetical protein F5050DRAFT_1880346 [Lentinula boryana]|uniref:DDE-1 domain-containing protein n=1 Tax=Lentinula boryana TaxID=40481 RepID=A0ABQ8PZL1_9AGAR|nr:hypothetical protein F5050DRAFT_1880346 [Lentinula boryana]